MEEWSNVSSTWLVILFKKINTPVVWGLDGLETQTVEIKCVKTQYFACSKAFWNIYSGRKIVSFLRKVDIVC